MQSYSSESKVDEQRIAPIVWSYCMRCSGMQPPKGRRRQNASSTKATARTYLSWTLRWAYLPFSWWGQKLQKEELLELYLEVYKLHRLPGSPPRELAILKEVISSLPDHQRCGKEEAPTAMAQPRAEGSHSSRSHTPHRGRKDDLVERHLATVHKAHQKALATVANLEKEIERLSHTQANSQLRARSKSRDCWWQTREGQKKRCCWVWFEDQPVTSCTTIPQNKTWWAGVQWWRLQLGGATGTEANSSLLPKRIHRYFWRWRWRDASGAHGLRV